MAFKFSTESLARRCSRRPWVTISLWTLLVFIAVGLIMALLGDALTTDIKFTNTPESKQANNLLDKRMYVPGQLGEVTEVVLVKSPNRTVDDPVFREFAEGIFANAMSNGPELIPKGTNYYISGDESLVSLDRHTTGLVFMFVPLPDNYKAFFNAFPNPRNDDPGSRDAGEFEVASFQADRVSSPEVVTIRSPELTVDDNEYRQFIEDLFFDLVSLGRDVIWKGIDFYKAGAESLVSRDRHATIILLSLNGDDQIDHVLGVIENARRNSKFDISIVGDATIEKDFEELSEKDLRTGELMFGLPLAVVILILVFGALAAAFVPLVLALASIAIALGLASLIAQSLEVSIFLVNMVFAVGLAVGIDYSLFIIARFREERSAGREKQDAIAQAGATASRAVLFSGMTVVIALNGLLLVPISLFLSLGLGAILVVIISVMASLTLLPAILSLLGDRVNAVRIPFGMRAYSRLDEEGSGGLWDRISRTVMRAPVISIVICGGLLIAAAVPLTDINIGATGVDTFPESFEAKKGYLALQQDFSAGLVDEAMIVIDGPIDDSAVRKGMNHLKAILAQDHSFGEVTERINVQRDLASLATPISGGDATSKVAIDAVKRLRGDYIPAAFKDAPARVMVTGDTAENLDYINAANDAVPVVFPFILLLSFLLLTIAFRSIVIPVKAMIMNLLSVGAAYGLMVLVFVKGAGDELFGFQQVDIVEAWVPIFLFAVLFGLSMDYHVFLLSRIRERFFQTRDNTSSVAYGIRSTGRLITGAALIMVGVFTGFASGDLVMFQQMGFGLAVAVFLDATMVRSVLVPASMKLLGHWNWYLPGWLRWLPRISGEEGQGTSAHLHKTA